MTRVVQRWGMAGMFLVMSGTLFGGEILSSFSDQTLMVAKVNVEKLKQVPPIQQALAGQTGNLAGFLVQIRQWTAVDLQTVKTLWFGMEKEDFVVIVLEGAFNAGEVKGAMYNIPNARVIQKDFVPVAALLPDDKHPGRQNLVAVLNPTTLVFGRPELAEAFIDAYTAANKDPKAPAPGALHAEAQKKLAVLKDSVALLHAVVLGLDPEQVQKQPFLAYLREAELQGDLKKDLVLSLAVAATKPELVEPLQKLAEGFFGVVKPMDLIPKHQPPRMDEVVKQNLLDHVTVAVEDGRVVARSKLDEAVLNDLLTGVLKAVPNPQNQ